MINRSTDAFLKNIIPAQPIMEYFPFPFKGNSFRYSNDSVKLENPIILHITPDYYEEIKKKRDILARRHAQAYQSLPHSLVGQWEILELIMNEMAAIHSSYFQLEKKGDYWTFYNKLLDEKHSFIFGDSSTLPYEPLDFIGRHVQEDLFFMGQRDGDLYLDAGQLCFPNNWSIGFNIGTPFLEFHSPVPEFYNSGLAEKVRNFLLRIEADTPWTRLSWTLTVEKMLDVFRESYDEWAPKKNKVTKENAGELVYLRIEDQKLFRLPESNGILFTLHTHMMSVEELKQNEKWLSQFYHVIKDVPDNIAEYKGYLPYKDKLISYLENVCGLSS